MSKMRGVDSFAKLWKRRTTIELPDGTQCDLLLLLSQFLSRPQPLHLLAFDLPP
jgi:hypothetical protein